MALTAKDFIDGKEILFVGYSRDEKSFSRGVYGDFVKAGLRVYPINTRGFTKGDVKVYGGVREVPNAPKVAYVILNSVNAKKAVADLAAAGVTRIWFQGTETADASVLEQCRKAGIDTFVGCAKMYLSDGFIHRLHGFFAGAKR
jgi:predicted CoA-binding protein